MLLGGTAFAQSPVMPSQERDAEKDALYGTFSGGKRVPTAEQQRIAYEAAREYLRKFAEDKDPEVAEVKEFVAKYEKVMREQDLFKSFNAKRYDDTFKLGKQIIEREPDNFFALGVISQAGLENARAGQSTFNNETVEYLRKAIKLLDDKTITSWKPFNNHEFAQGYLNAGLGSLLKDQSPVEAAAAFLNAAKSDSQFRTDPIIYHRLGAALLKGEFAQLSAEYNQKFVNRDPSEAQRVMLDKITKVVTRAIDAYARAVALSKSPAQKELRGKILEQLTALYKGFHNGSDAGLEELIAGVLSKPIPE
jgi:tetratricopeptide (TPR) repeat protein